MGKSKLADLQAFMREEIYPVESAVEEFHTDPANGWTYHPAIAELKDKAKSAGLWNLFLPPEYGDYSPGLSNLDYAPLAEQMGRVLWSSEVFNCNAPDTGNMEVLARYGSDAQKAQWLQPLLAGEIRSAFLMTEPDVASSDATNISTSIQREGSEYVINGRKWWSTGAMNPACKLAIVMGKTNPDAARHQQQSMVIVPMDTPGLTVKRPLPTFGYLHAPQGHAEIELKDVRVPAENMILGEGRGFEIAQGRLGPGRIHHCMRLIGMAQRSLELMCSRVNERQVFGKELARYSSIRQDIAWSRCEIEQARLLTLSAAQRMDTAGTKGAKDLIAMIKIVAPSMALKVIDRAMQIFGGKGLSEDLPLAGYWAGARALRLADGPDEVHLYQLGRNTIAQYHNS